MRNFEKFKEKVPEEHLNDFVCTDNSISVTVPNFGNVMLQIVEREPNKHIKFTLKNLPVEVNLWVQLKENSENSTKMKLIAKADIPFLLAQMFGKKIQEGIDKAAEILTFMLNKYNLEN
jgi:carbon monoxide dehydrogenase subunit G